MGKRIQGRRATANKPAAEPKPKPFNNPFIEVASALKKELTKSRKAAEIAKLAPKVSPTPALAAPPNEEALFAAAMRGAAPLSADDRGQSPRPLPPPDASFVQIPDEDAEVLAELASLIEGGGNFDITQTDEFIEGCVDGLDRRVLRELRLGNYSIGRHLDLHGLRREPAKRAVEEFLLNARREGLRCVLIVHGRGLNSKDNIPVLKELLRGWMEHGGIAKRHILAFASAQPHDGGAGAVYVLLRRRDRG